MDVGLYIKLVSLKILKCEFKSPLNIVNINVYQCQNWRTLHLGDVHHLLVVVEELLQLLLLDAHIRLEVVNQVHDRVRSVQCHGAFVSLPIRYRLRCFYETELITIYHDLINAK